MDDKQRSQELRTEQAEINTLLAACNQRLCDIIKQAGSLGQERQLKLANALMVQFNKRTRAYCSSLLAIGDTFEELYEDTRKSAGGPKVDPDGTTSAGDDKHEWRG